MKVRVEESVKFLVYFLLSPMFRVNTYALNHLTDFLNHSGRTPYYGTNLKFSFMKGKNFKNCIA
jgi:hypothetical protein